MSAGPRLEASLVEYLLAHRYATNIRELNALLWRAMSTSTGDAIAWNDASPSREPPPSSSGCASEQSPAGSLPEAPEPSAEEVRASLEQHQGNVTRAAQALGLSSRYVFYRLMKRYRIGSAEGI